MGNAHERDFASRMMNDATLRQMAAAKTMVNNENHMSRALLGRFQPAAVPCRRRFNDSPCRVEGTCMAFAFQREGRALRCKQRKQGRARTRLLMATEPNAAQFEVLLCLPTAPALPAGGSGDFGTSPFYGQLSGQATACLCKLFGVPDLKHNGGSKN
jgi:hypothetical protein